MHGIISLKSIFKNDKKKSFYGFLPNMLKGMIAAYIYILRDR